MSFTPNRSYERSKIVKEDEEFSTEAYPNQREYNDYSDGNAYKKNFRNERPSQDNFFNETSNQNDRYRHDSYVKPANYNRQERYNQQSTNYHPPYRKFDAESKEKQLPYAPRGHFLRDSQGTGQSTHRPSYPYNRNERPNQYNGQNESFSKPFENPYKQNDRFDRTNRQEKLYQKDERFFKPRSFDGGKRPYSNFADDEKQNKSSFFGNRDTQPHNSSRYSSYNNRNTDSERDFYPRKESNNSYNSYDNRSYDRNERFFREDRSRNFYNDKERNYNRRDREGRTSRFRQNTDTLFDVDNELLRLLSRRAELLQSVKRDNRISPTLEKKLRTAWELGVARVTKDPRIARDFFNLLQQIEPIPFGQAGPSYFNLSPQFSPVAIDLIGAVSSRQVRMFFALAVAYGAETAFDLYLSSSVMATVKAFNQLGGQLWWEGNERVLSRGGSGIIRHIDKVIPVGNSELSFYLVIALALLVPSRLKLVGDGNLRFVNTSAIRKFLPILNARMTTVIPGQEGIPVRIESSGIMPQYIEFTQDLPADFIISILLTSCARNDSSELEFKIIQHSQAKRILSEISTVFNLLSVEYDFEETEEEVSIKIQTGNLIFPEEISIELDPLYATTLLAMPAFAGGKSIVRGKLNTADLNCVEFLRSTGLKVNVKEDYIESEHPGTKLTQADYTLSPTYPFSLIFAVRASLYGDEVELPKNTQEMSNEVQDDIIHGFLAQFGLGVNESNKLEKKEIETTPWFLPDGDWGLALSLLAFMRPNILIVNPDVVSSKYPLFWRIYNSLPVPSLAIPQKEEEVKPTHRRIIATELDNMEENLTHIDDEEYTNKDYIREPHKITQETFIENYYTKEENPNE